MTVLNTVTVLRKILAGPKSPRVILGLYSAGQDTIYMKTKTYLLSQGAIQICRPIGNMFTFFNTGIVVFHLNNYSFGVENVKKFGTVILYVDSIEHTTIVELCREKDCNKI